MVSNDTESDMMIVTNLYMITIAYQCTCWVIVPQRGYMYVHEYYRNLKQSLLKISVAIIEFVAAIIIMHHASKSLQIHCYKKNVINSIGTNKSKQN